MHRPKNYIVPYEIYKKWMDHFKKSNGFKWQVLNLLILCFISLVTHFGYSWAKDVRHYCLYYTYRCVHFGLCLKPWHLCPHVLFTSRLCFLFFVFFKFMYKSWPLPFSLSSLVRSWEARSSQRRHKQFWTIQLISVSTPRTACCSLSAWCQHDSLMFWPQTSPLLCSHTSLIVSCYSQTKSRILVV